MITVDVFWGLFYIVDKIGVIMPFVMHLVVVPVVVGGGVVGSGSGERSASVVLVDLSPGL